ncbi:MAG: hypothetical protein NTV79_10490 [Candidatus Aureabacteria bacterium]|nr:hypothetical protein [Candidatus Auribacterota bacterium]
MSEIRVYNTLSRRKEVFTPIAPGEVRMYVCGVTVYDYCHLGHARCYVAFDAIRRYLQHRGYAVTGPGGGGEVRPGVRRRHVPPERPSRRRLSESDR